MTSIESLLTEARAVHDATTQGEWWSGSKNNRKNLATSCSGCVPVGEVGVEEQER